MAKIASDLRKPDGLVVVPPGDEAAFLAPLPISRLWGVGGKTATALRGVRRAHDRRPRRPAAGRARPAVRQARRRRSSTGRTASTRTRSATGEPAKSIGHEHTFDVDTADREVIERTLLGMADGVAGRLRATGLRAATVDAQAARLVVRHDHPPDAASTMPADLTEPIYEAAVGLAAAASSTASGSGWSA